MSRILVTLIVLAIGSYYRPAIPLNARGVEPPITPVTLHTLALSGSGAEALQQLAALAEHRGGWSPAPGDVVAFDPALARSVRATVPVVDRPPGECGSAKLGRGVTECAQDYARGQELVRFGLATFGNPTSDGRLVPRPALDDLLATYIEEVAHSWQEYFYETDGRGSGPRMHPIIWNDALVLAHGWEYQAKRYILSLDGTWLALSAAQRAELLSAVCMEQATILAGYANPLRHVVLAYGPPPGWPNPQGWPLSVPTTDELQAFCS